MRQARWILLFGVAVGACGPNARGDGDGDDDGDDGASGASADAAVACTTSISGRVFAPNGTLPLYNVLVYVPQRDPPPFAAGVQCGRCTQDIPGGAIASTTTDAAGGFVLHGVPAGADVPVIVTTGKWRRRLRVPVVTACEDTAIPDGAFRLPRNRTEGEMPLIAQGTGGCDGLAFILSKLGIDASEFGPSSSGPQAVTFYNGVGGSAPGAPQPAAALWSNLDELSKFDVVINACECAEHNENKTAPDLLRRYADLGGRVYGSHYHYTWTKNLVPGWQDTATWVSGSFPGQTTDRVDTTHAAGHALASWLVAVGASPAFGEIVLGQKLPNATAVPPTTTRWLYSPASDTTHYLSFQTPVGLPAQQQCGKVVYAGMHVSSGSVSSSFPAGCSTAFTPDEKALVFLLFDLQACNRVID
jgi:hypothetical protein